MEILLVNIIWLKLYAVWDALKELYYNSQQRWFIERFHVEDKTVTEKQYCYYDRKTHLPDWKQYPRHASLFSFWGAVYFCKRCQRLDKSGYYEYCLVSYADVAFIHEVTTGEKL